MSKDHPTTASENSDYPSNPNLPTHFVDAVNMMAGPEVVQIRFFAQTGSLHIEQCRVVMNREIVLKLAKTIASHYSDSIGESESTSPAST